MAFGKRGAPQSQAPVSRFGAAKPVVEQPVRSDPYKRPQPRISTGGALTWSPVLPLDRRYAQMVPANPGVFILMSGQREADAIYIAGSKDVQEEFLAELDIQKRLAWPKAKNFCFSLTPTPYEQAEKERVLFRRRHGRKPLLNSGF